jgi:hypothetical protein
MYRERKERESFNKGVKLMKKLLINAVSILALSTSALAHDNWINGDPVPPWVKKACCGPEDAHSLTPEQVHQSVEGWRVDGYKKLIPNGSELPSPDQSYWIFYRTFADGGQTNVYCFFVPIPGM